MFQHLFSFVPIDHASTIATAERYVSHSFWKIFNYSMINSLWKKRKIIHAKTFPFSFCCSYELAQKALREKTSFREQKQDVFDEMSDLHNSINSNPPLWLPLQLKSAGKFSKSPYSRDTFLLSIVMIVAFPIHDPTTLAVSCTTRFHNHLRAIFQVFCIKLKTHCLRFVVGYLYLYICTIKIMSRCYDDWESRATTNRLTHRTWDVMRNLSLTRWQFYLISYFNNLLYRIHSN